MGRNLVCCLHFLKDAIQRTLEKMLQEFYGINLNSDQREIENSGAAIPEEKSCHSQKENNIVGENLFDIPLKTSAVHSALNAENCSKGGISPLPSFQALRTPSILHSVSNSTERLPALRNQNISSFLEKLPSKSVDNFSLSPIKLSNQVYILIKQKINKKT